MAGYPGQNSKRKSASESAAIHACTTPQESRQLIRRRDSRTRDRITAAFAYITESPFFHENPTTIRQLRGINRGRYRYRIGDIRFIYRVDRDKHRIHVVQIDNRGDIY